MKNIVIVGFGWSSIAFLDNIDITKYNVNVISKNNCFNYTPLLAQNINKSKNMRLIKKIDYYNPIIYHTPNDVVDVNFEKDTIVLDNNKTIKYDYVVFAHGSKVNYYNIDGVEKNSYILKTVDDMNKIKNKLNTLPKDSKIAVMGCGPTGIEIIGSLLDMDKFNIIAIDGMDRPVSMFDNKVSDYIIDLWKENNVNIMMNNFVTKMDDNSITLKNNNKINNIKYDMGIWCGGVMNNSLTKKILSKYFEKNKRYFGLPVDDYMMINYINNINMNAYCIGDASMTKYPKTAQVAYQQGEYLAKRFNNDFKDDSEFKFNDRGQFSYIGMNKSIYNGPYFKSGGYIVNLLNKVVSTYNLYKATN